MEAANARRGGRIGLMADLGTGMVEPGAARRGSRPKLPFAGSCDHGCRQGAFWYPAGARPSGASSLARPCTPTLRWSPCRDSLALHQRPRLRRPQRRLRRGHVGAGRRRPHRRGLGAARSPPPAPGSSTSAGRTLMPGLIDAHVHAYASDVSVQTDRGAGRGLPHGARACACSGTRSTAASPPCATSAAATTRLSRAIADGLVARAALLLRRQDPVDDRRPRRHAHARGARAGRRGLRLRDRVNSFARMADGVDACIRGAREELRQGAHCIKIMGSGGVASPTDPDLDEPVPRGRDPRHRQRVRPSAAPMSRRTAIPASAVRRCVEFGVRSIEHGTLIDDETARFVAGAGRLHRADDGHDLRADRAGPQLGFPPQSQEKTEVASSRRSDGHGRGCARPA